MKKIEFQKPVTMFESIMGIDLDIGSQKEPQYAVYFERSITSDIQMYKSLNSDQLLNQIILLKPNVIATDNVHELLCSSPLAEFIFLNQLNLPIIQVTADNPNYMTSVLHEARRLGIPLRTKPLPLQTAIICTILANKGIGSVVQLLKKGTTRYQTSFISKNQESRNYQTKVLTPINHSKEMTAREGFKLLVDHPMIDNLIGIIGSGKASNIYLAESRTKEKLVIKSFKTYSSVTQAVIAQNYHLKSYHGAMLLAKMEVKNLKIFEKFGIRSPRVKFLDGSLVGMDAILDKDGSIAQPLACYKQKLNRNTIEEILDQILDTMYVIFKDCKMVHGDYSANNILFDGDQTYVIDVSQADYINTNTYTSTSLRIRFDKALEILFRDLIGIIRFFEKRYRIKLDQDIILQEFVKLVPPHFYDNVEHIILNQTRP